MTEPAAIEVTGLHKSYGDVDAVRGIDLWVALGQVFALLGPNGAGKTTTVEILEGHRDRDAGEVRVLGHDPALGERPLKERIGIVLQETGIEQYLTVEEVIDLQRGYYPSPRPLDEVIELVGLEEKRHSRVGKLSGGQQRRLDVALGLAGDPDLVFLDEPTTGFDPSARRSAWQMVKNLQTLGKTVVLTTHYMDEAQYLADRVAVIAAGRIVAEGTPSSLVAAAGAGRARVTCRLPGGRAVPRAIAAAGSVTDGRLTAETETPTRLLHDLTSWALDEGLELEDLAVTRPSLEDAYLELVGDDAEAAAAEAAR
ncbi:MAG: ABC transporter ATP-binding protein [Acidimicrobiales bacterium]